eukprot:GDKK01031475.1.p1 GENE.GDKK01031475.1~~GDKK01031475.1.p1  ORF type:complete len:190 (+),score=35.48 GDKK01031475.1:1-570(+)
MGMEQNRLLYETRLQRIRDSISKPSGASSNSVSANGSTLFTPMGKLKSPGSSSSSFKSDRGGRLGSGWRENMLVSLRSEKSKVLRQLEGAQERLARAHREAEMLKDLHSSLSGNNEEWRRRVDAAALVLRDQESAQKLDTSRLEDRVGALMAELDQISKTETGSKQHATCRGATTTTTSAIDEEDEDQA